MEISKEFFAHLKRPSVIQFVAGGDGGRSFKVSTREGRGFLRKVAGMKAILYVNYLEINRERSRSRLRPREKRLSQADSLPTGLLTMAGHRQIAKYRAVST